MTRPGQPDPTPARRVEPWSVGTRDGGTAPKLSAWHATIGDGGRPILVTVAFEDRPPTVTVVARDAVGAVLRSTAWPVRGVGPERAGDLVAATKILLPRVGALPSVNVEDVLRALAPRSEGPAGGQP